MPARKPSPQESRALAERFGDQIGDRLAAARRDFLQQAGRATATHEADGTFHSSRRMADEANFFRQELRRRGAIIAQAWKRTLEAEDVQRRGEFVPFAIADATRRLAVERADITNFSDSRPDVAAGSGYLVEVERGLVEKLTAELRLIGRSDLHHWWDGLFHAATRTTPGRIILAALLLGALLLARACGLF